MNRDELLRRLQSNEWYDIEFKEAAWAVPKNALSTVSAFANTAGGYLVFGVKETNGSFSISGVTDVDTVQNDFLGQVRDLKKISVRLTINGYLHDLEDGKVIAFYVPEAKRNEKPVYIDDVPHKAYVRRGGRDDQCTGDELIRFIRDASNTRFDSQPLADFSVERCFDETTVRWYRQRHAERNQGRYEELSDIDFLHQMACVVEHQQQFVPTRAGILVFGSDAAFRQILNRPVVDFQVYRESKAAYSADVRWTDRMTPVPEENLLKTWQSMLSFYGRHVEHPFSVDPGSLRRTDDPPDYVSFREAAINLLIHQDFGDQSRWPTIVFFRDESAFFNPGDAFSSREQLMDPGEKPVRNPSIVALFRRIGLSDQAGSGVGAIFASWRRLGNVPPVIDNDKADKSFRLTLPKEKLVTDAQLLAQASLGVRLSEQEAAVFAYVIRQGRIDLADIKALTGLNGADATALAQRLTVQVIIEKTDDLDHRYRLATHLSAQLSGTAPEESYNNQIVNTLPSTPNGTEQVPEQVSPSGTEHVQPLVRLTGVQWQIINFSDVPRSMSELLAHTGYRQRPHFKTHHIEPLLTGNVLRMTVPDKPRSSIQRYVLTEVGIKLKELWAQRKATTNPSQDNEQ